MLCSNCNYILSGEEAFCPHCGQAIKMQEIKKDEEAENDIVINVTDLPSPKGKSTIFDQEPTEGSAYEAEEPQGKKSRGGLVVISLFVLILVATAVFTCLEYFDLAPVIASYISEKTSSPEDNALITTASELSGTEGMLPPEISYKPVIHTVTCVKPLPLRKGPDEGYAPVGYVQHGTRLQVTGGCLANDRWVYVYIPAKDAFGWLDASYLMQDSVPLSTSPSEKDEDTIAAEVDGTTLKSENSTLVSQQKHTAKITAEKGLHMRTGPGVDFEAVTVIGNGEEVTVIEAHPDKPDWIYVQFGKDKGYVSRNYLKEN